MITKVHIENFKCFKEFDIELGPFNVLIGPNDSGKSAFVEAIRVAAWLGPRQSLPVRRFPQELAAVVGPSCVWGQETDSEIGITVHAFAQDGLMAIFRVTSKGGALFASDIAGPPDIMEGHAQDQDWKAGVFSRCMGTVGYYQFAPDALRQLSSLEERMTWRGEGFPTFLDDILREDRDAFIHLEKQFYERFPHYTRITIEKHKSRFVLYFHTARGEKLQAALVSDGVMLSLAFLAISNCPNPPSILLIEEPENGVHHASLKEIVATLRDLSEKKQVQVIMTTHSPYLLDCVEPEEVRVFAKGKDGAVRAARLSGHPEVDDLKKHFMTGEIWTELDEADVVAKRGAAG